MHRRDLLCSCVSIYVLHFGLLSVINTVYFGNMIDDSKHISTVGIKNIPNRDKPFKNADAWLEDKRAFDGAEGLWRVYDDLYDLTNFVNKHPGGKFWLEVTKGTDITEAFESHHISTKPEIILKTYVVRQEKTQRSSPFTFEEHGFYKTLKRNVREALKTVPKNAETTSKIYTDALLMGAFAFATFASVCWSYTLGVISGLLLASTVVAAPNYFHQKDNFRMYYSDIGLMKSREWRIIHILSHHLFTNSVADMQAYISEPIANLYPETKSVLVKYGSWIYTPLILWPTIFYVTFFVRMYQWIFLGYSKSVSRSDFLPLTLPLTMYCFSGQSFTLVVGMWLFILAVHAFWFALVGIATTHYHPDIFMDGDTARPENERDWGINQLDTCADKHEVTGSHFLVLVTFGDHALHHLFPTFDHGVLQYLYPVVRKTMQEFNLDIRMTTFSDIIGGFFRNLAKDKPNTNQPNLLKSGQLR